MSGDRGYASVPERITWTTGFHNGTDKIVLGALSTFANFETGKGARVSIRKLASRAELEPRTVQRALRRLHLEGWITVARRTHRRATAWDIAVERLATTWVAMKAVGVTGGFPQRGKTLNDKSDVQLDDKMIAQLHDKTDVQTGDLNDKRIVQAADLNDKNDVPIPSTYLTPVEPIPSAPALRAGWFDDDADENREEPHAPQPTPRATDLRADGSHRPHDATGDLDRPGSADQSAPGVGLPLRQGPDRSRGEGVDRPRAAAGPHQQTFGPIDVDPPPARSPQWGQLAEALREGLKRKSG